ncbi:cyp6 [Scenedesmus sp. PABB004]|nr:cyp6 [Scenedesmus sp. PABB004]
MRRSTPNLAASITAARTRLGGGAHLFVVLLTLVGMLSLSSFLAPSHHAAPQHLQRPEERAPRSATAAHAAAARAAAAAAVAAAQAAAPAAGGCHPEPGAEYGGDTVEWGASHLKDSAAACCEACAGARARGCNVWVWCGEPAGCGAGRHRECWLKRQPDMRLTHIAGGRGTNWTSGALYADADRAAQADAESRRLAVLRGDASLPLVWLDVAIAGRRVGRVHFVLFSKTSPRAAENFRRLCTGEAGAVPAGRAHAGEPYALKGKPFYRIIHGFIDQAGANTDSALPGGGQFKDDPGGLALKHDRKGLLSMANTGPDTNDSHFSIMVEAAPHLNGHYTIFGEAVDGHDVIDAVNALARGAPENTATADAGAVIVDAGQGPRGQLHVLAMRRPAALLALAVAALALCAAPGAAASRSLAREEAVNVGQLDIEVAFTYKTNPATGKRYTCGELEAVFPNWKADMQGVFTNVFNKLYGVNPTRYFTDTTGGCSPQGTVRRAPQGAAAGVPAHAPRAAQRERCPRAAPALSTRVTSSRRPAHALRRAAPRRPAPPQLRATLKYDASSVREDITEFIIEAATAASGTNTGAKAVCKRPFKALQAVCASVKATGMAAFRSIAVKGAARRPQRAAGRRAAASARAPPALTGGTRPPARSRRSRHLMLGRARKVDARRPAKRASQPTGSALQRLFAAASADTCKPPGRGDCLQAMVVGMFYAKYKQDVSYLLTGLTGRCNPASTRGPTFRAVLPFSSGDLQLPYPEAVILGLIKDTAALMTGTNVRGSPDPVCSRPYAVITKVCDAVSATGKATIRSINASAPAVTLPPRRTRRTVATMRAAAVLALAAAALALACAPTSAAVAAGRALAAVEPPTSLTGKFTVTVAFAYKTNPDTKTKYTCTDLEKAYPKWKEDAMITEVFQKFLVEADVSSMITGFTGRCNPASTRGPTVRARAAPRARPLRPPAAAPPAVRAARPPARARARAQFRAVLSVSSGDAPLPEPMYVEESVYMTMEVLTGTSARDAPNPVCSRPYAGITKVCNAVAATGKATIRSMSTSARAGRVRGAGRVLPRRRAPAARKNGRSCSLAHPCTAAVFVSAP